MSLFFRGREERRAITTLPWNYGGDTYVNLTQDKALTLGAVWAAVRHIIDFGSTLPLKGYRMTGAESKEPMPTLPQLFRDLAAEGRLVPWLGQGIASLAVRGNAVGFVLDVDGFGLPARVDWLSMDRVSVDDSTGVGRWYVDGRSENLFHRGGNLLHIPWMQIPGRTLALSPIAYHALTIGVGLDAQQYGGDWFKGGGFPPATFKNLRAADVSGELADGIRERLVKAIRKRQPLVFGKQWEYTPITIPPEEAQFIEAQKLTASQVAGIYGIAPDEVGGEAPNSMSYQNEEHRQTVRAHNLRPYLLRFEHAFASWLPALQIVRFNVDAVTRADIKTRTDVEVARLNAGISNIDEVRADEDMPPLPDGQGQKYAVPMPKSPAAIEPPTSPEPASRRLSVITGEEGSS